MRLGLLSLVIALSLFGADASAATLDRIKIEWGCKDRLPSRCTPLFLQERHW